jgi:hypothetical protein
MPREAEVIPQAFSANGFENLAYLALWLGEPEKPIFARAGKADFFKEACQSPAVLVCHFKRLSDRLTPSTPERLAEALP